MSPKKAEVVRAMTTSSEAQGLDDEKEITTDNSNTARSNGSSVSNKSVAESSKLRLETSHEIKATGEQHERIYDGTDEEESQGPDSEAEWSGQEYSDRAEGTVMTGGRKGSTMKWKPPIPGVQENLGDVPAQTKSRKKLKVKKAKDGTLAER